MKKAKIMDGKLVSCWPCVHEESCEGSWDHLKNHEES